MLFNSLTFLLIFLPILFLVYFCSNTTWKNKILLIFSIFFYAWGEPKFVFLILISIVINYYIALGIEKFKNKRKLLLVSLIINLGLLFVFKYLNFTIEIFSSLFSLNSLKTNLALPIGISFYTFQVISYIIDVYKGRIEASKKLFDLATYLLFFPQLIAGPIVRYSDIVDRLKKREHSIIKVSDGLRRFIIGLSKKVLISNSLAVIVDNIFIVGNEVDIYAFILGIFTFSLQIYYDFGGYSDMAIGLGKIFGFDFKENFNYPYSSLSLKEFWTKWQISLSSWFKDYVYIPLGGSKCSNIKWIRNVLIVWLLTGLWHGSSNRFAIWGLYFGILLIIEKKLNKKLIKLPTFVRWFITYLLINVSFIIFRIENICEYVFVNRSFLEFIRQYYYLINYIPYIIVGFVFAFPTYKAFNDKLRKNIFYKYIKDILLICLFLLCIVSIVSNDYTPFIYFNF